MINITQQKFDELWNKSRVMVNTVYPVPTNMAIVEIENSESKTAQRVPGCKSQHTFILPGDEVKICFVGVSGITMCDAFKITHIEMAPI